MEQHKTWEQIQQLYTQHNQQHVLQFLPQLNDEEKKQLIHDCTHVDVSALRADYQAALAAEKALSTSTSSTPDLRPFENVRDVSRCSPDDLDRWRSCGLSLLSSGRVGVVLMAGGAGTRLGSAAPKGCFDIGLNSHKSLFQLQAERISTIRTIAAKHQNKDVNDVHIKWYIMTSLLTHSATLAFFADHNNFSLPASDLFFFPQSELPALSLDGSILLDSRSSMALSPNGNGGIFQALHTSGALKHMKDHGIVCTHVYGVDNALIKVADPLFIGFAFSQQADCANKVVLKTQPHEKVGVMCLRNGKPSVVEYSELPVSLCELCDSTSQQLVYSAANIAQHYFTVEFLQAQVDKPLTYHIARKCIPYVNSDGVRVTPTQPNGVKLEYFVFDSFERAHNMHALAVPRQHEFAPVKNANAPGAADTPATAKQAINKYAIYMLERAGAHISAQHDDECEVSPLVSYEGEGLESLAGAHITLPYHCDKL